MKPEWRVLVHSKYRSKYDELVTRVGQSSAERLWDFLATQPDRPPAIGACTRLRGAAARPKHPGWSSTYHYEASSKCRIDYQYCDEYQVGDGDPHKIVVILTINFSSH